MKNQIDNIEKYVTALNNLIGADHAYFTGDENIDTLVELINIANQQQSEIKELQQILGETSKIVLKERNLGRVEAYKEFAERLKPYEQKTCCWCKHSDKGWRSSKCDEIIDDTGVCVKLWCFGWQKFESNIDHILKERIGE